VNTSRTLDPVRGNITQRRVTSELRFTSFGRTSRGCVRPANEDAILVRPEAGLWAVADGMGGHDAGEVASQVVVDSLAGLTLLGSPYKRGQQVEASIHSANSTIRALASQRHIPKMGSTVAALYIHDRHFACMWAGDSRAYLLRNGRLQLITRDHSVIQEVIDTGLVDELNAKRVYGANAITRAVGIDEAVKLETAYGSVEAGDHFLLCSDGVTAVMSDTTIEEYLSRPSSSVEEMVEAIETACTSKGAPDNLAIIVVAATAC